MAKLRVKDEELIVRLSWWEKAAARRVGVRAPLAAVRRVAVERDWWRALRGVDGRGLSVAGGLYVGTRRHGRAEDFVALRRHGPHVCVELRPPSPFSLIAVSAADPDATAAWLRDLAPDLDSAHEVTPR
ncbi:hypothetical protein [Streptomyces winkii]|uniref:hypothetical protein n=1 Tax=Streptomyces winkii TaxID=3051178 RepID=UPI0028D539AE|nr:hypothetical protein [Streptomyces sp. DSM 40971]